MWDQCSTDDGGAAVSGFDDGRGAKTEGTEAAVGMYLLCMEGPMYCSPHYTSPVAKSPLSGDRLFINEHRGSPGGAGEGRIAQNAGVESTGMDPHSFVQLGES